MAPLPSMGPPTHTTRSPGLKSVIIPPPMESEQTSSGVQAAFFGPTHLIVASLMIIVSPWPCRHDSTCPSNQVSSILSGIDPMQQRIKPPCASLSFGLVIFIPESGLNKHHLGQRIGRKNPGLARRFHHFSIRFRAQNNHL